MPILHDFEYIIALTERHFLQAPIVQYQQIGFRQLSDEFGKSPVTVGNAQRFK